MGMLLFAILFAPFSAIWYGYALSVLWGWFVVPFGAPPISIAWAYGLLTTFGLLTSALAKDVDTTKPQVDAMIAGVAKAALWPAMALGLGWVAKGFM